MGLGESEDSEFWTPCPTLNKPNIYHIYTTDGKPDTWLMYGNPYPHSYWHLMLHITIKIYMLYFKLTKFKFYTINVNLNLFKYY